MNRAKRLIEDIGGIWAGHGVINKHSIFKVFPMSYFWNGPSSVQADDTDNFGDGDFGDAGGDGGE